MGDHEDEELQMALQMSLQGLPPEAKRSKPPPPQESVEDSAEVRSLRSQRELMASAAEKRIRATAAAPAGESRSAFEPAKPAGIRESSGDKSADGKDPLISRKQDKAELGGPQQPQRVVSGASTAMNSGEELYQEDAEELFLMVFGSGVSKSVLDRWSNQGIRFSTDPETFMGLVQHEGGPCGVLATIQAYVLKYLLFLPDILDNVNRGAPFLGLGQKKIDNRSFKANDNFASITEDKKARALACSMVEILFLCGNGKSAVVATIALQNDKAVVESDKNEIITKALETVSIETASDLQKIIRIHRFTSPTAACRLIEEALPVFRSRMGAMLFLISALLSRGMETVQADRDDPSLPLVTAPFGHASQEIVNLLICGQAVPNVFDDRMDLGGGMFLKGIPTSVEVGFLTLLESLNLCKVGDRLKCPKWPIWVVGSESHYTVLFALNPSVQEENELEGRETKIRRAFDAQDQSGGGGFISVEGFQQVLRETGINFPAEKFENLTCTGFVVWSEFWQALLDLDKSFGGFKDSSGLMGKKQFDLYHFNGIAKSVSSSGAANEGETPVQKPRLCKLNVSVPPKWTQEEFLADVMSSSSSSGKDAQTAESNQPAQHAPLVDCVRTRWPRATCSWVGDTPSIV